ncbi:MAG: hypothetical protein LWW98_10605 [Deltaproteobacteria bacterium]|nr:hypothetical protein [Deltaproteobacteria bacterium]
MDGRTIAVLDLYNVDEEYLSNIFNEGIKQMLHRERLSGEAACSVLKKIGLTQALRRKALL